MQDRNYSNYYLISLSLLIAILLTLLPLPNWALLARPHWILLVLLFWLMTVPFQVNVGIAFLMGLLTDLVTGTLLGQHAFIYTLIAYIFIKFCVRFNHVAMYQQLLFISALVGADILMDYILHNLTNTPVYQIAWLSIITSAIVWPWLSWVLRECQHDTDM